MWSVNRIKRCCYIQYVTTFAIPDLQSGIDKWRVLSRARHLWFKLQCCDKCLAGACRKIAQWRHFQHSKISKLKINTPYVYGNKCNFIILNWWWAFFGVVPFLRYWPRSSPKLTKNQFLEKNDPLTETFQNFATKGFTGTWIQVFLPCFAEIGKAEVNKRVRGIHHEKRLPLSLWLLKRARQIFYRITGSPFSISLSNFVQIRPVFEEIYPKMSSRLITISASRRTRQKPDVLVHSQIWRQRHSEHSDIVAGRYSEL